MNTEVPVEVTHFINPHMFWFKVKAHSLNEELLQWEKHLEAHFFHQDETSNIKYQPSVDEIVAVFVVKFNRWIRAKVDFVPPSKDAKDYILWALDYGIPVEAQQMRQLPLQFQDGPKDTVFLGGLSNIIPAQKMFNLEKLEIEMKYSWKWSSVAVEIIRKLINDAKEIIFIHKKISNKGQIFGNLLFTTESEKTIQANIILLELDQANKMPACDFFTTFDRIYSNRLPGWVMAVETPKDYQRNHPDELNLSQQINRNDNTERLHRNFLIIENAKRKISQNSLDFEKESKVNQEQAEIQIDDFLFYDSTSTSKFSEKDEYNNSENGPLILMKAGALRRRCLSRYQYSIPLPPVGEDNFPSVEKSLPIKLPMQTKNNSFALESSAMTDSKPKHQCHINMQEARLTGVKLNKSCNSAIKLLIDRRTSKRHNFSSKSQNQLFSNASINFEFNSCVERNKVDTVKHIMDNDLFENKFKEDSNRNLFSMLEINRMDKTRHVIPAGFDLRNLIQRNVYTDKDTNNPYSIMITNSGISGINSKNNTQNVNDRQYPDDNNIIDFFESSSRSYVKNMSLKSVDENCLQMNFWKHLVLVHGKHVAKPIEKLKGANFCDEVHQELINMRLTSIYRIQSYSWPHIMRGNSSIIISSARTGKTLCYLPALCSLIKTEVDECLVPDAVGPIGIIVAQSAVEVEKIRKMCLRFLHRNHKKLLIIESYGLRNSAKIIRYLLNGCDILVTTHSSLIRLLRNEFKLFDSKRLRHLVFDNVEFMQEEVRDALCDILKNLHTAKRMQLVVIANHWSPMFSTLFKIGHNTQLCIGAYIEAAVYGRSEIRLKLTRQSIKPREIIKFIGIHSYLIEPLIVICNTDEEVEDVLEILKSHSCFHIACSSRSTSEGIDLAKAWQERPKGDMSILVCTDDILPEIKITAAKNIIHYSLPNSWTRFSYRFSCLFSSLHDFVKSDIPVETSPSCLILLDENNNSQLPKLIHFLQIHNVGKIPREIISVCNNIKIQKRKDRTHENRDFCSYLMEIGKCTNIDDCSYRHELTSFDLPKSNIMKEGTIIFKILSVISPTHYTVRLLDHQLAGSKFWKKMEDFNEYMKFNIRLAKHFSCYENHRQHWPIEVDDICVVSEGETYHRGKILCVIKRKQLKMSVDATCRVKLVDIGRVINCKSSHLLHLPKEFKQFPHQAVNLRLSGIVPYDHEQDWSSNATETVKSWFQKYVTANHLVIASIKFSLMDTIWVHNVKIIEKLESIKTYVTIVDIKSSLLEKKFGIMSNYAEELLKQKAFECGILSNESMVDDIKFKTQENLVACEISRKIVLGYESGSKSDDILTHSTKKLREICEVPIKLDALEEKWENLTEQQFSRVLIGAFYDPNNFFVQHLVDLKGKEILYKAIDEFIEEDLVTVADPKIGWNCLVKHEGKYNRAKITKVFCDGKCKEVTVSVFFCDIGISKTLELSEVFHSTSKLVNMLPFQAIRCKIMGITSTTYGVWTEESSDRIYDEILAPAQFLYARPVKSIRPNETSVLKYWRYEVDLLDCTTEEDLNINRRIVDLGFGKFDEAAQISSQKYVGLETVSSGESSFVYESNWENYIHLGSQLSIHNKIEDLFGDVDIQFSEKDIFQLIYSSTNPTSKPDVTKKLFLDVPPTAETESNENHFHACNQFKVKIKRVENETNCYQCTLIPHLTPVFKSPLVFWKQSQSYVFMQILAPDIEDYYLRLTATNLLFIAIIQAEVHSISINFCGCVDSSFVSHKIRGLNVLISIPKALKGFKWPRLTYDSDKLSWLKYNHDSVKEEQEVQVLKDHCSEDFALIDSSDTNSSSDDLYDIPAMDDEFDPLGDEFV